MMLAGTGGAGAATAAGAGWLVAGTHWRRAGIAIINIELARDVVPPEDRRGRPGEAVDEIITCDEPPGPPGMPDDFEGAVGPPAGCSSGRPVTPITARMLGGMVSGMCSAHSADTSAQSIASALGSAPGIKMGIGLRAEDADGGRSRETGAREREGREPSE